MNRFVVLLAAAEYNQSFIDREEIFYVVTKGHKFDVLYNELNRADKNYVEASLDLFDTIKNFARGAVR
jgi:hypothetical protein